MCVDIYIILHHHFSYDSNLFTYVIYGDKRCQNECLQEESIIRKHRLVNALLDINEYRHCNKYHIIQHNIINKLFINTSEKL